MATIAATGQEKFRTPFEPSVPGFKYVEFNDIDAIENAVTTRHCSRHARAHTGRERSASGRSGIYQEGQGSSVNEKGILLIIDEVQTGIGRTGRLFCYENYGIAPDIMTLAKGLAGGVPIGAMLCTDEVATGMRAGDHGSTFGGNPLACAAGNVVMDEIPVPENDLLANVNK